MIAECETDGGWVKDVPEHNCGQRFIMGSFMFFFSRLLWAPAFYPNTRNLKIKKKEWTPHLLRHSSLWSWEKHCGFPPRSTTQAGLGGGQRRGGLGGSYDGLSMHLAETTWWMAALKYIFACPFFIAGLSNGETCSIFFFLREEWNHHMAACLSVQTWEMFQAIDWQEMEHRVVAWFLFFEALIITLFLFIHCGNLFPLTIVYFFLCPCHGCRFHDRSRLKKTKKEKEKEMEMEGNKRGPTTLWWFHF